MTIWQILGFIGIGTVIGTAIQVYFNSKMQNKRLLFEARVNAYQGLIGRIYSGFISEFRDKEWPDTEIGVNSLLSEPILLGSDELIKLLIDYRHILLALMLNIKNLGIEHEKVKEQFESLKPFPEKIHEQMRKDLFIK